MFEICLIGNLWPQLLISIDANCLQPEATQNKHSIPNVFEQTDKQMKPSQSGVCPSRNGLQTFSKLMLTL